jgi:hypothetical protein
LSLKNTFSGVRRHDIAAAIHGLTRRVMRQKERREKTSFLELGSQIQQLILEGKITIFKLYKVLASN